MIQLCRSCGNESLHSLCPRCSKVEVSVVLTKHQLLRLAHALHLDDPLRRSFEALLKEVVQPPPPMGPRIGAMFVKDNRS